MKNHNQEAKLRRMRQYHRNKRWRLSAGGLMIPHAYPKPRALSWWDDVGFILNGRRVMILWVHPRMNYADAIERAAFAEVGKSPRSAGDMFDDSKCTKRYKRLGRSREKVISYQSPLSSPETKAYYQRINASTERLSAEGIVLVVRPSMSIKRLDWCIGVELCIPIEVLAEDDVMVLASGIGIHQPTHPSKSKSVTGDFFSVFGEAVPNRVHALSRFVNLTNRLLGMF